MNYSTTPEIIGSPSLKKAQEKALLNPKSKVMEMAQ